MAARAPTGFNTYSDLFGLMPRKDVLSATPSNITDDQQFALDKEELIWSDMWADAITTSDAWREITRQFAIGRHMCGNGPAVAGTQENWAWCVYAWADAMLDFEVRLTNVGLATASTITVNALQTTPSWRGFGQLTCYDDGTENELVLEVRRIESATPLHVTGIGVFSA